MTRYAKGARPASFDYDYAEPFRPSLDVPEHYAVDTGLIWETGEPIMRMPNPIGFGRDEEWS